MSLRTMEGTGRLLAVGRGGGARADLVAHLATHGRLELPVSDDPRWRAATAGAISASGLAGRGGAAFPTAGKWRSVLQHATRPVLVVNAMEGEPASSKDHALLCEVPHLVLDGAEAAAAVVGARQITVCVADGQGSAVASVERAVAERQRAGIGRCPVSVARPPGRYVAGEESALARWLDGRRGVPEFRTDKSVPLVVSSRPALVHNAETLAQVALIIRHGPQWFRQAGTPEAPGSALVSISGAVHLPGVYEVELGTPVADVVGRASPTTELSAVLLGGYGGAWLAESAFATPYAPVPLQAAGATLGAGVVVALPASSCGLAETARLARYMAGQSAGQCGPCVFGLPAIAADLEQLAAGRSGPEVLERVKARVANVERRGACGHPDGLARVVRSGLAVFAADVLAHAEGRACPGRRERSVLTLSVDTLSVDTLSVDTLSVDTLPVDHARTGAAS